MSEDRITVEELKFMSIFSEVTGATPIRCIVEEESGKLLFLVNKGELGKAVGRNGANIRVLGELFKRSVEVFEYSDNVEEMVRNLFPAVRILEVSVSERGEEKLISVRVREEDKGRAIGRNGRNVKRASLVLSKLFGPCRVVVK
ncbi:MAG: NusA-like transcription termination signal-binding factor [Acidilobaceae archaeon]|nr:NusA-like transcription termination signal-binding factor [Acidilobaceae archaeon]